MSEAGERSEPRPEGRVAERPTSGRQTNATYARELSGGRNELAEHVTMTLTLLSRSYCHLCDEMLAAATPLAAAAGATVAVIDVDADPELERRYGDRVPVLLAGDAATGTEICHFRLDPARLKAVLALSAPAG